MEVQLDFMELYLVTLVILNGSASQAAIGMGLNLIAILLLLLINPIYAPGPVLVASFALSFLALWRVPAKVDRTELKFALIGLATGIALAGLIAALIDSSSLTRLLGAFLVLGVGLALSGWSAILNQRNLIAAGGGAGFLGTIAGVHAPPIALLYQGQEPDRVRGAILTFVGIGNLFSIIALVIVGRFGSNQALATMLLIPGVLLGLWLAPSLVRLINVRFLRLFVLSISAISGLLLVFG
ncbi:MULTISPECIES: sulfite exporter TauE/SafE family protein [unclassified Ruegeria]|uniref:sulfite exporter TauE/SafE family protein n=1 Tax=unclassified Ruegeria TaxID=2625375 RepID=UPI001AE962EA|nr:MULTISPECIES: sulfite exporter TauE/SafE family protein [unclassified Ruegeria]